MLLIFSSLGVMEAITNLYYNYHYNLDLSEQYALDCDGQESGCGGGDSDFIFDLALTGNGIIDENSLPWQDGQHDCESNLPFEYKLTISGSTNDASGPLSSEEIKEMVLAHGPLKARLKIGSDLHDIIILGYGILKENDIYHDRYGNPILVPVGSDYIGSLYWICKNSYGFLWGDNGYYYLISNSLCPDYYRVTGYTYINTPINIIEDNPFMDYRRHCYDYDNDGYYNWGLGDFDQELCSSPCQNYGEDSNDDDYRIGPYEEDYSGQSVNPEMFVSVQLPTTTPISNHGFCFFNENPKDFTFRIENPGSAMLHLDPNSSQDGVVSIIYEDGDYFGITHQPGKNELCMFGDETDFGIHFSTGEPGIMHIAYIKIGVLNIDEDVLEDFEFALVFNGCDQTGEDIFINGYTQKSEYEIIPGDIYIERNGVLEVTGSLAMFEESDIFVEPGGQLVVDGGVITGITGDCTGTWHGIDIWGNSGQPQTLQYQGKVSLRNGGRIEYAIKGIETGSLPDPRRYPSGGIVSCVDAVFKDNVTDIILYPFRNLHPDGHEIPNMSRFCRTQFITTDDFYSLFDLELNTHILFDGVGGINVMGCTFENNSARTSVNRGKGIESYGAGYFIFKACIEDNLPECPGVVPGRFENLDYGIRAFNTNSYATIKVDSVDFIHNRRGIHMILVDNPTIIKSAFEVSDPEGFWPGEEFAGLYLDQFTTGFIVEENTFNGPSAISTSVGIQLLNTGTDQNEIYNNSFTSLYYGISAVGVNRLSDKESEGVGLCVKCNDFQQCRNDIYVTCETDDQGNEICTVNSGIAQKQGVMNESEPPYYNTLAAGNTFSDVNSANYFNNDHCGHIDYIYHGDENPSNAKIFPEPVYGDIEPEADPHADYTKLSSCPSHLGGSITLSVEKSILNIETGLISAYEDTLLMEIDGGNTEGLNFEVLTSYPEEALAIRQELIGQSPFLSDTVMISAIEKEDVLPGAMIRDVLVQNPQAPKSKKVMDALDQRQDSIPDYMMEEIMQGMNTYGAKELLEQELGNHIARRDQAWKNLNQYYKNDTMNLEGSIDSLMALQEADNRLSTRYDLAFMHLSLSDSMNAFGVLDEIPSEFDLSSEELSTHSQYLELFYILWDVKNDTTGLDSLQIQALFDLSSSYYTIPGLYASNVLIRERLLNYNEPVYFADPVKNTPVLNKILVTTTKDHYLSLFPNPAGNYFIAYYYLNEDQSLGMLTISEINGRELKAFYLKDKQNQLVIPTQGLSVGAYIVSLICKNHLIDSQKLTIIK